jgi:hypothetical protein
MVLDALTNSVSLVGFLTNLEVNALFLMTGNAVSLAMLGSRYALRDSEAQPFKILPADSIQRWFLKVRLHGPVRRTLPSAGRRQNPG